MLLCPTWRRDSIPLWRLAELEGKIRFFGVFFQLKREKERPIFGIATCKSVSFASEPHLISMPNWREFVASFQALMDCFSCQNYIFAIICVSSKIYRNKGNIWMRFETTSFSPVRKLIPNLQINVGMWFPVFSLHMSSQTPNRSNARGRFFLFLFFFSP